MSALSASTIGLGIIKMDTQSYQTNSIDAKCTQGCFHLASGCELLDTL